MITQPLATLRRHRSFVRDVATLITGKTAALVITFIFTPIISRLFEPGDFGIGALFTSLCMIASTLATLSWERAAVVAKAESEAVQLCRLAVYSAVITCGVLWSAGLLALAIGLPLPYADTMGIWVWVVPVGLFLLCVTQIADSWLTRTKRYKTIVASDLSNSITISGTRVVSGAAFGSSVWGVIAGYLLGSVAEITAAFSGVRPWATRRPPSEPLPDLRRTAAAYKDFPLYSAPNAFIKQFSQDLPTITFAVMFSPAVVGFYAMASRLARLPLKFAAQALQRVVLQRLARVANEGRPIAPAYTKVTVTLAAVALPPFALIWLVGDTLLTLFLGAKWEQAGHYVVILVPWLYMLWVSSPASTVMTVLRRQALLLRAQILLAIARLTVFAIAYAVSATPETTLHAFVAVSAIASVGSIFITYVMARRADRALPASPAA
jgi:O-antigen/teichoic acid export membrane protein